MADSSSEENGSLKSISIENSVHDTNSIEVYQFYLNLEKENIGMFCRINSSLKKRSTKWGTKVAMKRNRGRKQRIT